MNEKILVVDDERSIRESLSKVLRAEGYEIVLAENGQQAIEKLAQEPIDLLPLDLGLPGKDGWAKSARSCPSSLSRDAGNRVNWLRLRKWMF